MTCMLTTLLFNSQSLKLILLNVSTEFHTVYHSLLFDIFFPTGSSGYHFHWLLLFSLFCHSLILSLVLDVSCLHDL